MVKIRSTTFVQAPLERCFKLALSVDLQREATGDRVLAGRDSGLQTPGGAVRWRLGRMGWRLECEQTIDLWRPYSFLRWTAVDGSFGFYQHEIHLAPMNDGTRMRHEIRFELPLGAVGWLAARLFLRRRLRQSLERRNALLKQVAASDSASSAEGWHRYLDGRPELDLHVYQAEPSAGTYDQAIAG